MKALPKYTEEEIGINPFLMGFKIQANVACSPDQYKKHNQDGQDIMLPATYDMDHTQRCEVYYTTGMKAVIMGLTDKAQRLLLYIQYSMVRGKDYFQFNPTDYMNKNEIKSRTTVTNAITELKRYGIIANAPRQTVYWVNPDIMFGGNRLNYYNQEKFAHLHIISKRVINK